MVKVRKGKRGHQNSGSLVFRISRSSVKPISDDSGIKCSSTEEQTSSEGEQICTQNDPLKIKIPISLLNRKFERNKASFPIKTVSSKSVKLQNENHTYKIHKDKISGAEKKLSDVNQVSFNNDANILHSELISSNIDEDNLGASKDILISIPKQTTSRIYASNTCDHRRSSRRILLRVLKNSESDHSLKEMSSDPHKFPLMASNICKYVPLVEKRKRGRKPGTRVPDSKKRKYCRRGRPPKYTKTLSKRLGLGKSIISSKEHNEKVVLLTPPKNSVWTLVPKELLESDFFKTQVRKIQVLNPPKKIARENLDMSSQISFSPSVLQIPSSEINGNIQFQTSKVTARNAPGVRQTMLKTCYTKRPTVINLKSEKQMFHSTQNQQREMSNPQFLQTRELSENQNNLQFLYNKARMLEEIILKNYYDLASGNLNGSERRLSNFLPNTSNISPQENVIDHRNTHSSLSTTPIWDLNSGAQMARHRVINEYPSVEPVCEDVDTLSRNIIVQSLQVLFSEEAVLT